MQVLLITPNANGFGGKMLAEIKAYYEAKGADVVVRDLSAEKFVPFAVSDDPGSPVQKVDEAQLKAQAEKYRADLQQADEVFFVTPIYFGGAPALLQGFFERVCSYGWAFGHGKEKNQGPLAGKKAMFVASFGAERTDEDGIVYANHCFDGLMIDGLAYFGMDVQPLFAARAPGGSAEQKAMAEGRMVERIAAHLANPYNTASAPVPVQRIGKKGQAAQHAQRAVAG